MPLHDTSRIQDDAAYWSALSDRVASNALAQRQNMLFVLSGTRAAWITAACVAFALAAGWMFDRRSETLGRRSDDSVLWTLAVGASDRGAIPFEVPNAPPSIGALLLSGAAR
jgi:hypothetical protein